MIKPISRKALNAALCLYALDVLERLDLAADVTKQQVVQRLGVARSYAYQLVPKVEAALDRVLDQTPDDRAAAARAAEVLALQVRNAVLEYRVEHPGAWVCGGRTTYTKDLVAFIVELATRSIGPSMTQADFADACGIPLPTLKDWWANAARQLALPLAPAPPDAPSESTPPPASEPEPLPSPPELELGPSPELVPDPEPPPSSPAASDPADAGTLGLSADMLRIVAEYETWHGALPAFVDHLRSLGLRYGRQMVTQILCPQRRCRTFPPVPVPGECPEQRNQPNATSHLSAADGWNVLDTRR